MSWGDILRRNRTAPAAPIPREVRQEIEQAPEWWDRQYRALHRRVFPPKPFDPADHEGHCIVEERTFTGRIVYQACTECPPADPYA